MEIFPLPSGSKAAIISILTLQRFDLAAAAGRLAGRHDIVSTTKRKALETDIADLDQQIASLTRRAV